MPNRDSSTHCSDVAAGKGFQKPTKLEKKLEKCDRPVVGLDFVIEYYDRKAPELTRFYSCSLCSSKFREAEIVGHVLGVVHRLAVLREFRKRNYEEVTRQTLLSDEMEQLVEKMVRGVEEDRGRGIPCLRTIRPTLPGQVEVVDIEDSDDENLLKVTPSFRRFSEDSTRGNSFPRLTTPRPDIPRPGPSFRTGDPMRWLSSKPKDNLLSIPGISTAELRIQASERESTSSPMLSKERENRSREEMWTPRKEDRSQTPRRESSRSDSLRRESRMETPRREYSRSETPRRESSRMETPRKESSRFETPRRESRMETPRRESSRSETPRRESRMETPRRESSRSETPRREFRRESKSETPRRETPRLDTPRRKNTESATKDSRLKERTPSRNDLPRTTANENCQVKIKLEPVESSKSETNSIEDVMETKPNLVKPDVNPVEPQSDLKKPPSDIPVPQTKAEKLQAPSMPPNKDPLNTYREILARFTQNNLVPSSPLSVTPRENPSIPHNNFLKLGSIPPKPQNNQPELKDHQVNIQNNVLKPNLKPQSDPTMSQTLPTNPIAEPAKPRFYYVKREALSPSFTQDVNVLKREPTSPSKTCTDEEAGLQRQAKRIKLEFPDGINKDSDPRSLESVTNDQVAGPILPRAATFPQMSEITNQRPLTGDQSLLPSTAPGQAPQNGSLWAPPFINSQDQQYWRQYYSWAIMAGYTQCSSFTGTTSLNFPSVD